MGGLPGSQAPRPQLVGRLEASGCFCLWDSCWRLLSEPRDGEVFPETGAPGKGFHGAATLHEAGPSPGDVRALQERLGFGSLPLPRLP